MEFPKTNRFDADIVRSKIMGPNTCKLTEELLDGADGAGAKGAASGVAITRGSVVLDLGSGSGISSAMLAREYELVTYAADLWSDPSDNMRFFESLGLTNRQVIPVKADATQLPFAHEFFDAVVCVDSYNYYGRDPEYLGACLLPHVKSGGTIHLAIAGMVRDCHDAPPACLRVSWTAEQLDYIHDMAWWRKMLGHTDGVEIVSMREMSCTREAWADWIACDNDYARGDRAAVEAGALDYLSTIAVVLRKA